MMLPHQHQALQAVRWLANMAAIAKNDERRFKEKENVLWARTRYIAYRHAAKETALRLLNH